ncbi:primosome protein [Metamycoplasma alkalescens]|uniref:Uncharacterized protein n=1 Tax=Metamycoplasma alkalescens TaxID=45363 RepID=A0A318U424_9BACT|nr:primosome protein [Metamycoplasma alkalescens]PYF42201.1 hypothetical protein BCF88_1157 [Metamycoplasma alkalescens]
MDKKILNSIFSFDNKLDAKKLKEEVLSKDFIQNEIKRLNLNEYQIQKGMGILQRYHDFVLKNNKEPNYKLCVDAYDFLAEDYSDDENYVKYKKIENFWLTSVTELDPIIQKYFNTKASLKIFSLFKKSLIDYFATLIETKKSLEIKKILEDIVSKNIFQCNICFLDKKNMFANNIFKYIASLNAIKFNKSVAYLTANDLYNYISANPEEKKSIMWYLNRVEILFITNLTLGVKPQWFLDLLINIFETRQSKNMPTLISSSRDIVSTKTKFLSSYYYSKENNENDLENLFKEIIFNNFKKIIIN